MPIPCYPGAVLNCCISAPLRLMTEPRSMAARQRLRCCSHGLRSRPVSAQPAVAQHPETSPSGPRKAAPSNGPDKDRDSPLQCGPRTRARHLQGGPAAAAAAAAGAFRTTRTRCRSWWRAPKTRRGTRRAPPPCRRRRRRGRGLRRVGQPPPPHTNPTSRANEPCAVRLNLRLGCGGGAGVGVLACL